jgi:pimeloyl-ACP methyl ester carboxylesterase
MAVARAPAVLGPAPSPEVVSEVEAMLAAIHPAGYRVAAVALAYADTRDVLRGITVPTLIITGEHDGIVPPNAGTWLQSQINGARIVSIPNAGHLAGQEEPAAYNNALREHLSSVG